MPGLISGGENHTQAMGTTFNTHLEHALPLSMYNIMLH